MVDESHRRLLEFVSPSSSCSSRSTQIAEEHDPVLHELNAVMTEDKLVLLSQAS